MRKSETVARAAPRLSVFQMVMIGLPFVWVGLFVALPFLIAIKVSVALPAQEQPPFTHFTPAGAFVLNLAGSYGRILSDGLYASSYLQALKLAGLSSLICLVVGYPLAYGIARSRPALRPALLLLVMLPFWTSFLIRIYAWMALLKANGIINGFLIWARAVDSPLTLMNTPFAVYLVMVYIYLPFMVLPLYAALEKLDPALLEAASDLGCKPLKAFFLITVPLSLQGAAAGLLLVFIPAVGEYVIPELMGGPSAQVIGRTLFAEFFANRDWPAAAAIGVVALLLLAIPIIIMQRLDERQSARAASA
ncbi:MAG: ABC transporter permease subunit [Parvibaculaceae bacterium]